MRNSIIGELEAIKVDSLSHPMRSTGWRVGMKVKPMRILWFSASRRTPLSVPTVLNRTIFVAAVRSRGQLQEDAVPELWLKIADLNSKRGKHTSERRKHIIINTSNIQFTIKILLIVKTANCSNKLNIITY